MEQDNKTLNVNDKRPEEQTKPGMRQILIETDGNDIKIVKAEVSGSIELKAILQTLILYINNKDKKE